MNKILITGSSGMLGSALVKSLDSNFEIYATDINEPIDKKINFLKFDLESDTYDNLVRWSDPDIIIHCAAITDGNYCQSNPFKAFSINSFSVQKIIDSTKQKVKIIYISTDAVFSSQNFFPNEKKNTDPQSIYGKSKELGEFFLTNSGRDYLILRTTIVGNNLNNLNNGFVDWIINSVKNNQSVGLFSDVLFNPISIWDFINEIIFLLESEKYYGNIFHLCGLQSVTKYDFGLELIKEFNLNKDLISRAKISEFKERAKRSKDQTMDCSKYINLTKRTLPKLSQTIKSIKFNYDV